MSAYKRLNNLKDVLVPAVSKVLTVKQDKMCSNNKVPSFISRNVKIPLVCKLK